MSRVTKLLVALLMVASFEAGFAFDRWLHRPIQLPDEFSIVSPTAAEKADEPAESGIFPPDQGVCTAFNNICWMKT